MGDEIRHNNATSAAGDPAVRCQIVDSSGNIISTFSGGAVTADTELPAATSTSDGTSAPATSPMVVALIGTNQSGTLHHFLSPGAIGASGQAMLNSLSATAYVYNGANYDAPRTPKVFTSFATTAITAGTGATIWTPTSSKKFRVMGISISTSAAGQLILGDNAVGTVIARSPTLAAGAAWQLGAADMGNGILSAAINNVLKLDGPTGNVMGMVWGTEE